MMKKTIGLATSFLLATSLLVSSTSLAANDEKIDSSNNQDSSDHNYVKERELNDTFNSSHQVLKSNDYVHGFFSKNDTDVYKIEFTGSELGELMVTIDSKDNRKSDIDFNVNVYNDSKEKIKPFQISGGSGFQGSYLISEGTYYIETSDLANINNGEVYELNASTTSDIDKAIYRIAGSDRYETAAKTAFQNQVDGKVKNVVLASGEDFPDALSGAPLAYHLDAEILLTQKSVLPEVTKSALKSLKTKKVTIIGGENAVSSEVEQGIKDLGIDVDRIAGKDRYATAVAVAKELPDSNEVAVVYGKEFPDALAIAPYAARNQMPILLTDTNRIPQETKKALENYDSSLAVGGTAVISDKVVNELPDSSRISGKDRYETSVAVAEHFDWSHDIVNIATGADYADALSGSMRSAYFKAPLLLTPKTKLVSSTKAFLKDKEGFKYTILGGQNAVSNSVELEIAKNWE